MTTGRADSMPPQLRERQARKWHEIWRSEEHLTVDLLKEWQAWATDPENRRIYRKLEQLDELFRTIPPPPWPTDDELHSDSYRIELSDPLDTFSDSKPTVRGSPMPISWRPAVLFVLALAVVGVLVSGLTRQIMSGRRLVTMSEFMTAPGERRYLTLADNSVIRVGGATRLSLIASQQMRHVVLEAGEALFDVHHDPQRPFEVDVGGTRIIDLGTSFSVRYYTDGQVVVAVAEGAVAITSQGKDTSTDPSISVRVPAITVNKGQEISSNAAGVLSSPHSINMDTVTSWVYGRRFYRGTQLLRVVEDLQLYTVRRIELDPALASFLYSGVVDQTHPEKWARQLNLIFPVKIDETDPHTLIIRCIQLNCRPP